MTELISGDKNYLAHNLTVLLQQRNLQVNELGRALDFPTITIHKLKSGEQKNPTIGILLPISEYFGISLDQLVKTKI